MELVRPVNVWKLSVVDLSGQSLWNALDVYLQCLVHFALQVNIGRSFLWEVQCQIFRKFIIQAIRRLFPLGVALFRSGMLYMPQLLEQCTAIPPCHFVLL